MNHLGVIEEAELFRNAFLSSKIAYALRRAENDQALDNIDLGSLQRGIKLFETIISGSLLVEKDSSVQGIAPSTKGLSAFTLALRSLPIDMRDQDLGNYFLLCRNYLQELTEGKPVDKQQLQALERFFLTLAKKLDAERERNDFVESELDRPYA